MTRKCGQSMVKTKKAYTRQAFEFAMKPQYTTLRPTFFLNLCNSFGMLLNTSSLKPNIDKDRALLWPIFARPGSTDVKTKTRLVKSHELYRYMYHVSSKSMTRLRRSRICKLLSERRLTDRRIDDGRRVTTILQFWQKQTRNDDSFQSIKWERHSKDILVYYGVRNRSCDRHLTNEMIVHELCT